METIRKTSRLELPKSFLGRIVFAAVCLLLLPVSAVGCWCLLFVTPPGNGLVDWLFRRIVEALSFGMFFFSLFGLLWAVAAPEWADHLFQVATRRLMVALLLFCLLSLPFVFWALFRV